MTNQENWAELYVRVPRESIDDITMTIGKYAVDNDIHAQIYHIDAKTDIDTVPYDPQYTTWMEDPKSGEGLLCATMEDIHTFGAHNDITKTATSKVLRAVMRSFPESALIDRNRSYAGYPMMGIKVADIPEIIGDVDRFKRGVPNIGHKSVETLTKFSKAVLPELTLE